VGFHPGFTSSTIVKENNMASGQGPKDKDPEDMYLEKLNKFVGQELDDLAKKTHISLRELMEIIEEVNIVKLHEAAHEALKKISYAVDLTPEQIFQVFTDHKDAPLEDLCKRLHEKSLVNRSKF
jgi:hypothetical protein